MKKLLLFCLLSVLMSMTYIANAQSPGSGCCFWLENALPDTPADIYSLNPMATSANEVQYYYFKFDNTCGLSDTSKISIDWQITINGQPIDAITLGQLGIEIETRNPMGDLSANDGYISSGQLRSGQGFNSLLGCPNKTDYPGGVGGPFDNTYCPNTTEFSYYNLGSNNLYNFFYVHFLKYASDNNLIRLKINRKSWAVDFQIKVKLIERLNGTTLQNFYTPSQNLYIGGKLAQRGIELGSFTLGEQTYSTATANACSGDTIKVGVNPQGQPYSYVMFPTIPDPVAQMIVNVPFYNQNWNCADYIDSVVTYTMTWAPVPGVPNVNNYSRCGAGTLTFTGSHPLQAQYPSLTYRWYSSSTLTPANLLYTGIEYTTPSLPEDTHIELWVTASISGCEGLPQHVDGYIFKQPGLTLTNPTDLCPVAGTKMVYATASNVYMDGVNCNLSMNWVNAESVMTSCSTFSALVTVTNTCNGIYPYSATLIDNETGCSVSANGSFTLRDTIAPTFMVPGPFTAYKGIDCSLDITPTITGSISNIADNCSDPNFVISYNDVATPGSCPDNYTITRTCTVADHCGNSTSHDQIITVRDIIAPTITAPADVTLYSAANCSYDANPTVQPVASDNCTQTPVITFRDDTVATCVGSFDITRTWRATDNCGNYSEDVQMIYVRDNTPPSILEPADVTIYTTSNCTFNANPTEYPVVSDNCSSTIVTTFEDDTVATCTGSFEITRTWRATDNCNNYAEAIQVITVRDNINPAIEAPENVTIFTTASCTYDANPTVLAVATDNCTPSPVITYKDDTTATCTGSFIITRTWRATDNCNNFAEDTQVITVRDNLNPTITAPDDITIYTTASCTYDATPTVQPVVADNCTPTPVVTFTDDTVATCTGSYIITRTWKATDNCENFAIDAQVITIRDNMNPTITAPEDVTIYTTAGCTYNANPTIQPVVADNCTQSPVVTFADDTVATCTGSFIITRTWRVTDNCENFAEDTQVITVRDNINPTITAPEDVTINTTESCSYNANPTIQPLVADNCTPSPVVTFSDDTVATCTGSFIITRTWRVTDNCGNFAEDTQVITIRDNMNPSITAPANVTIYTTATCTFDATPTVQPEVADNCTLSPVVTFVDDTVATCTGSFIITRTWRATDNCNNYAEATQTITVRDNLNPTIEAPANVTIYTTESCTYDATPTVQPVVADNCTTSPVITFADDTVATCTGSYIITRTWRATDNCTNYAEATQTITIRDNIIPTFTVPSNIAICKNNQNIYNADTNYTGRVLILADNCTATENLVINFTDQTDPGTATTVGTILRTWTVTDACGNVASSTQTITLNPAPVASIAVSPTPSFCLPTSGGTNVTATLSALPAVDYTYYIIRPALDTVLSNTASQTILVAGTVTFSGYVIDNVTGCRSSLVSASTEALLYPDFTITVIQNKRGCRDDVPSLNGSLSVTHFNDYTFTISPNSGSYSNGVFSNLPINNYSITAEHPNGCTYTKQQAIIFDTIYTPVAKFELGGRDADTAVCWTSGMFLSTLVTDLNNVPAHQYNFHIIVPTNITTDGSNGIRIYAPGIYAIGGVIENVTTGCRDTAWHYVYAMAYPTVDVTSTPFCLNTNVALSMTATPTLVYPHNYTYQWTSENTLDTVLGTATTLSHLTTVSNKYYGAATANYSYSGLNAYGATITFSLACTSKDSVTVTPLPLPEFTAEQYSAKRVCNARDTGSIAIGDGWNPAFAWTLTRVATGATSTITSSTFQVPDSGYYNISVTNLNGCTYTLNNIFVNEVRVGFNAVLHADVDSLISGVDKSADLTFCWNHGSQRIYHEIRYTNIPTFSYQYTILTPTEIAQISNQSSYVTAAGAYILSGYVTNLTTGCVSNIDSLTVYAVPTPQYSISDDATICKGDSIKVGIDPTTVFATTWTYGPTVADSLMINPMVYGTNSSFKAYVNVSSSLPGAGFACSVNDSVTISINNQPAISQPVVTDVTCNGLSNGTITVDVTGTSPFTYEWSDGDQFSSTDEDLTNIPAGTYSVTVTDAVGCITILENIVVSQPATLVSTDHLIQNVSCNGGSNGAGYVVVTGGTAPYQYMWTGSPVNNDSVSGLTAGTYYVQITDAHVCVTHDTLVITQPEALSATVASTNVTCNEAGNGTITISSPTGGHGSYQYSINGTNWFNSGSFVNVAPGSYTPQMRDSLYTTCTHSFTAVNITQPAALNATVASTNVTCNGAGNGTITISSPTGGYGSYQYSINGTNWFNSGSFVNVAPGSYTPQMRDSLYTTCTHSFTAVNITQPAALNATVASTNVTCNGAGNGTITISSPTGGYGSYQYSINGTNWFNSGSFVNVVPGTYTPQMRDSLYITCTHSFTDVNITQPAALNATVASTNVTCNGAGNGTITISSPTGGYGSYQYSINGTNWFNSGSFVNVAPGSYTPQMRDSLYTTCTHSFTAVNITQPAALSATVASTNVTCNGAGNGTITISSPTGGYGSYQYSINGTNWFNSGSFVNVAPGSYTPQMRDSLYTTCTHSFTAVNITQPAALNATVASTNVTCNGAGNGTITISSPTGGYGSYQYSINGTNWFNSGSFVNVAPGSYTPQMRDSLYITCTHSFTDVNITQPAVLSATVASTNVTCNGANNGTITISSPTGGYGSYQYSINGTNWFNSGSFVNVVPGTYTPQMRDSLYITCTHSFTDVNITQPAALNATVASTNVTCNGAGNGTITISSPTGGYGSYQYSINGTNWFNSGSFVNVAPGSYTPQMRDSLYTTCTHSFTAVNITQPAALSATVASTNVTCNGAGNGTITISSPTGGYGTYQYSINGTNWFNSGSFVNVTPGSYTPQMRDSLYTTCTHSFTAVNITQPAALNATVASTNVTCNGAGNGTITISSPTGGYGSYQYSINGTNWFNSGSFVNVVPGTYTPQMRDSLYITCTHSFTDVSITQPAVLNATVASTNVTCNGAGNGTITISSPTGGYGSYQYSINGTNWFNSGSFINVAPGSYTPQMRDSLYTTCTHSFTAVNITQPAALSAIVANTDITCNGANNGIITITTPTGGYGTYQFRLGTGTWQSSGTFTGLSVGTYVPEMRDSLYPTCTMTLASQSITQPAVLSTTPTISNHVSCNGGNNGKGYITAAGGTTPYQYSWSTTATTDTISNLTAGTYYVTVTDFNLCTKVDSITITQPAVLAITVDSTRNVSCNGTATGAIYITVTGGTNPYEYFWSNENDTQDNVNIIYRAEGYSVTVTDGHGCTATASSTFTQPEVLTASKDSVNVKCYGDNTGTARVIDVAGGTAPYSYLWAQGGTDSDTTGLLAGTYVVTITDAHGCSITRSFNITQPLNPLTLDIIDFTTPICTGDSTNINLTISGGTPGSPAYSYEWYLNTDTIVFKTTEDLRELAGIYRVKVTDGNGCVAYDTVTITNFATPTITTNEPPQVCLSTAFYVTAKANQIGDWSAQAYKASTNVAVGAPQISLVSDSLHYTYTSPVTSDTIYIVYTFTSNVGGCVYTDTTNDIKMSGEPRLRIYRNSTEDNYATINENQPVSFKFMVDNSCATPNDTRLAITYSIYRQDSLTGAKVLVTNLTNYISNANSFVNQMDLVGTGLDAYYPSSFNYSSTLSQAPAAHFPLATSSGAVLGSDQFDFFSLAYFQNRQGTVSINNFTQPGIYTIEYALISNYSNPAMTTPHGNQIYVMTTLTPSPLGGNQFFTGTYYTKVWSTNTMTITVNDVPGSPVIPGDEIASKPMKLQPQMKIYPNPSAPGQLVYIEVENISGDATIAVSAINGSVLQKTAVTIADTQKQVIYNLNDLVPGIYFVTLTSKDAVITKKVIISPR